MSRRTAAGRWIRVTSIRHIRDGTETAPVRTAIGRGDEADLSADTAHHIPVSVGSDQVVAGGTVVDKILMGIGPPDIIQDPAGVGFSDAWDPGSNRPVGDGVDQFPEAELAQAHDNVIDCGVVEKRGSHEA